MVFNLDWGALAEQFVGKELVCANDGELCNAERTKADFFTVILLRRNYVDAAECWAVDAGAAVPEATYLARTASANFCSKASLCGSTGAI